MYTREYKTCGEYPHIHCNDSNMNSFQPSMVTSFYKEESISSETGEPMIVYHDPIYMLFNQERLALMGNGAVEMWVNQMNRSKVNPLAELRKQCSDEDLVQMIKSRHLQSPSEILSWSRLMTSKMDEFKSEVAKLIAEQQIQKEPDPGSVVKQTQQEPDPASVEPIKNN